jgi:uracil-DNA glycosylase
VKGATGAEATPDNRLARPLAEVLDSAPESWRLLVERWRASEAGRRLIEHVEARRLAGIPIYPAAVLRALELTPRESVRVVILGQDPYHGAGQAEGLAFSVPRGVAPPPSLRNILVELERDLGARLAHGHLGEWARRGVLLLNAALTVEAGSPGAHAKRGWEALSDAVVASLARDEGARVFMLWGAQAQAKEPLIAAAGSGRHLVLKANHPSPLSARRPPQPFFGCGHFGLAMRFLAEHDAAGSVFDWAGDGV